MAAVKACRGARPLHGGLLAAQVHSGWADLVKLGTGRSAAGGFRAAIDGPGVGRD